MVPITNKSAFKKNIISKHERLETGIGLVINLFKA